MVTSTGCFSSLAGGVGRLPLVGWCEAILVDVSTTVVVFFLLWSVILLFYCNLDRIPYCFFCI